MKRVEIFNDNYSALGFGDTLNKLSYLYRTYENENVEFLFHSKRKVFENIMILKEFCFEEPEYKKVFIDSEHFLRSNNGFKLINHEYWPTKIKWNRKFNFIAINFYTKIRKIHQLEVKFDENVKNENSKCFTDGHLIKKKYKTKELFSINDERGIKKIDKNPESCLIENMKILSDCSLFVTSQGGMSHLSRARNVPTILFFKKTDSDFYYFLNDFIDNKIQKFVNTTEELVDSIDYYLRYDKFN